MDHKQRKIKGGYTLVETIFYVALFSVLTIVVINSLITMTKSFKATTVGADLVQSATIMERISREIRQANGVNTISATTLKINTKDDLGNNKTIEFALNGSNIELFENDVLIGNLNTPNIEVTALSFTQITITTGAAVKMSLSVKSARDSIGRIESFYDTIVLRGAYND